MALTNDQLLDIAVAVYKERLDASSGSGPGTTERMLAEDADGGVKLRNRAEAYLPITRAYVRAFQEAGLLKEWLDPVLWRKRHKPNAPHGATYDKGV